MVNTKLDDKGQKGLKKLFQDMTEHNFTEVLGWPDFSVTEYISDLLVRSAHVDGLHPIKKPGAANDESIESVIELLYQAELESSQNNIDKEKRLHTAIGDMTLFMAGLFPEHLFYIKTSNRIHHKDFIIDYIKAGKRSYGIAAALSNEKRVPDAALYQALSSNFEICVAGLGFVRMDLDRKPGGFINNPGPQRTL